MLHASEVQQAVDGYQNIKRLKAVGYGDTRVTSLTTVQSLIDDIITVRNSAAVKQSDRPFFDAAIGSIKWAESVDLLDTTKVTALTTVATDGTAATTDLSYCFFVASGYPTTVFPRSTNDSTVFHPVYNP